MELMEEINNFYKIANQSEKNELKEWKFIKRLLLYPTTIMDEDLLNLLTGIATALSINIFTSVLSFENSSFSELLIWVIRFVFALVFNMQVIKLTVTCTLLRNEAKDEADAVEIPGEWKSVYRNALIHNYNKSYSQIKRGVVLIIVASIVLFLVIVIYPVGSFLIISSVC